MEDTKVGIKAKMETNVSSEVQFTTIQDHKFYKYLVDAEILWQACFARFHDLDSCDLEMAFVHLYHFNNQHELYIDNALRDVKAFVFTGKPSEKAKTAARFIKFSVQQRLHAEVADQNRLIQVFTSPIPEFGYIVLDRTMARPDQWMGVLACRLTHENAPACKVLLDLSTCNGNRNYFSIEWSGTALGNTCYLKDLSEQAIDFCVQKRRDDE